MLALSLAFAFPAADTGSATASCPSYTFDGSMPEDGAADVSADDPVLLLYRGGCGETLSWSLDGPEGLVGDGIMTEPEYLGDGQAFRLPLPLMTDTAYTLTVTSNTGYDEPTQIAFSTAAETPVGPAFDDLDLTVEVIDVFSPQQGLLDILADVDVTAPAGVLVRLSENGGQTTSRSWISDGSVLSDTMRFFVAPGELCVSARAEDAAANAGEWVEVCQVVEAPETFPEDDEDLEPYKPSRCQSAPAPGSLLILTLAPLLTTLRRRQ